MRKYRVIGAMSGTSMDGLDLAFCHFEFDGRWKYEIYNAVTYNYNLELRSYLSNLVKLSGFDLIKAHNETGRIIGEKIAQFIHDNNLNPDLIASHGHTVFHAPENGFTFQAGNGNTIAAINKLPVIYDFRILDVALGGQGAPLVPIGDEYLFGDYRYCLNLGGIGNISFNKDNRRLAFDICPVNIILNYLSEKKGHQFDPDGSIARSGSPDADLLAVLDNIPYYKMKSPKTLDKQWILDLYLPVLESFKISTANKLRTFCEHIAQQISHSVTNSHPGEMLMTGGGVHNSFLIELIKNKTNCTVIIPNDLLVNYKEAMVFALMGVLRYRNEINCLSSVTGARSDSSCGVIVEP